MELEGVSEPGHKLFDSLKHVCVSITLHACHVLGRENSPCDFGRLLGLPPKALESLV